MSPSSDSNDQLSTPCSQEKSALVPFSQRVLLSVLLLEIRLFTRSLKPCVLKAMFHSGIGFIISLTQGTMASENSDLGNSIVPRSET